ncbi:hypothetical protein SBRCBS47491_002395 [Sporothrix bragantina]|uniref:Stc1 domain-containing protein n=1 Tax=Sporothrix bragantina TaxID=671064 RepID=A0ABP0B6I0_9PEZI
MVITNTCTDLVVSTTRPEEDMPAPVPHKKMAPIIDLLGPDRLPSPPPSPPHTPNRPPPAYSSSSSSPPPSSPPTPPPPPRHKAFYQVTKLEPAEIARRIALGICTYCADDSHSRHMCAQGRLMRKVTKAQLDQRLKRSVCPICGDPEGDKHCKQTCPRRIHVQAILDAKQDALRKKKALPPLADLKVKDYDVHKTIEYETVELRLPTFILKGNIGKAFGKAENYEKYLKCEKPEKPSKGTDYMKTGSWWRKTEEVEAEMPVPAPVVDPDLLIDLDSILSKPKPTTAATITTTTTTTTTMDGKPIFPSYTPSGTLIAAKVPQPNLLDTEVTEVVWGNMATLPCERAGSQTTERQDEEASQDTHSTADTDGTDSTNGSDDDSGGASVDTDDTDTDEVDDLIDLGK